MMTKLRSGIILGICLVFCLAMPIAAAETGSIFLDYHADDLALPNVPYGLYHIYTIDEKGNFSATEEYEPLGNAQDLTDNEAWLVQSQTAHNYILAYGKSPDLTGSTDDMGRALVDGLESGVYLLKFTKLILDEMAYETDPILVIVPGDLDSDEEWNQTIIPKVESYPEAELRYRDVIVLKTWRNDHDLGVRPDEITINLFQDSSLFDSIILSEDNSWSYYWKGLDGSSEWALLEEDLPEGYTVEITYDKDNNTTIFHVQNTYDRDSAVGGGSSVGVGGGSSVAADAAVAGDLYETEVDKELTQTGALLWPIPVLICTGAVFILLGLLLRKENHEKT